MQIVSPTPSAMYTGIVNAVAQISSTEGARSLWRGIASVALGAGMHIIESKQAMDISLIFTFNCGSGPAHAVYFSTYEFVRQRLGGNEGVGHHPFAVGEKMIPFAKMSLPY